MVFPPSLVIQLVFVLLLRYFIRASKAIIRRLASTEYCTTRSQADVPSFTICAISNSLDAVGATTNGVGAMEMWQLRLPCGLEAEPPSGPRRTMSGKGPGRESIIVCYHSLYSPRASSVEKTELS